MTFDLRPSTFDVRSPRHRGLAALLVLFVLAVGAILGWAMLANASMQAQISGNASASLAAEATAESGLNLGVYYLLHPDLAPSLDDSKTFYPGGANISLGSSGAGTLTSLTITRDTNQPSLFTLVANASAPGGHGNVLARSSTMRCMINTQYQVRYGLASRAALTLPGSGLRVTVNGDARGDNNLLVNSPSSVTGTLYALGSNTTGWQPTPTFPSVATPAYSDINLTKTLPTYIYQGRVCTADTLLLDYNGGTMTALSSLLNPANVFVASGNRSINGTTVLNGTLIVPPSCTYLRVGGNLRITPKPGMPALIVAQNLQVNGNNRVLRFDGLTWIGSGGISSAMGSNSGTDIQIYGALMLGGSSSALDSRMAGTLVINYTPDNLNVPDLCNQYRYPTSAKILYYGKQDPSTP